ncbi:hypothetical protein Bbelb_060760 [Branchiostoma belcheri]|nr:hypothetical protein Bbelb_060760 [Branchiostoma belcheri]
MEESSRPALKSGAACFQRSEETSSLPGERAVTSFPSDPFYPAFRVPMQAPARCATVRVDWKCTSRCDAQFILSRDVSRTDGKTEKQSARLMTSVGVSMVTDPA